MSEVVRSARRGNFFIVENSIIENYLEKIGSAGLAVYCMLAKHADRVGSTFVGIEKMGKVSGLAPATVKRAVNLLLQHELIRVVKTDNPPKTIFWILPVPVPKPQTETPLFDSFEEESSGSTGISTAPEPSPIPRNKEEQDPRTNNTQESNNTHPAPERGGSIFSQIIEAIDREYSAANSGDKCPWKNKRSFKELGDLLERYPKWTIEQWEVCVANRYRSQSFMAARLEPWEFISKLYRFIDGPLDQFGKPLNGGDRGTRARNFEDRANEEIRIARNLGSGKSGPNAE